MKTMAATKEIERGNNDGIAQTALRGFNLFANRVGVFGALGLSSEIAREALKQEKEKRQSNGIPSNCS